MNQKLLLPALILLLAVLAGLLWKETGGRSMETQSGIVAEPGPALTSSKPGPDLAQPTRTLEAPGRVNESLTTTVVIPLLIDLELVLAKPLLKADSAAAMGSSATARIRGSMHDKDGRPLSGYAEFVAGPNRGRVLQADGEGRFGANDLYAGISLVALRAPRTPGAEREVLLREGKDTQLNVGFGRPASVQGLVKDDRNNPLVGAKVVMDGQESMTDKEGRFYFPAMTSGPVPVYISKPGYATKREKLLHVTAGMKFPPDKLRYTLYKAATLKVSVPERIGGPLPGQLFLSGPLDGTGARSYPWHLKSPISLSGGESIEIEDLPAGRLRLQYFRPGAIASPAVKHEVLTAGVTKNVTFNLKPAPTVTGRVTQDGKPVAGALVHFEMPDVTSASVQALKGRLGRAALEMGVLSQMPPAIQKVVTQADGRFLFSAAEEYSKVRYLHATSADGKSWGGRVVRAGENKVEIEMSEARTGFCELVIETTTRFQALPVSYAVNGEPHTTVLTPSGRLIISDLPEGEWRLRAVWSNDVLWDNIPVTLRGKEEKYLPLPQGAIDGQSKKVRDALQ